MLPFGPLKNHKLCYIVKKVIYNKCEPIKEVREYANNVKNNSFLLDEIKNIYYQLTRSTYTQKRSYELEKLKKKI